MPHYILVLGAFLLTFSLEASLVRVKNAPNRALLVGVPDDLEGINVDMDILREMTEHPTYHFESRSLWERQGTPENVKYDLDNLARQTQSKGTLFFYYSGHGETDQIETYGSPLKIRDMVLTLKNARKDLGPINRLVLFFDACHAGGYIDPFNGLFVRNMDSLSFVKNLEKEFLKTDNQGYWNELFIFASSQAHELSQPSSVGSVFTLGLKKSYDELLHSNGTLKTWAQKTIEYTQGQQPVAHFHPLALQNEKLF